MVGADNDFYFASILQELLLCGYFLLFMFLLSDVLFNYCIGGDLARKK